MRQRGRGRTSFNKPMHRLVHRIVRMIRSAKDRAEGKVLRELHTTESRLLVALGEMKPTTPTTRARVRRRKARQQAGEKRTTEGVQ